jgi:hypothetical protein
MQSLSGLQVGSTRLSVWALLLGALWMAACSDGYPPNDETALSPVTMSQDERLDLMNEIGDSSYLPERWRYKFNEECELRVSTGEWFSITHGAWLALDSARLVRGFDKASKTHAVQLQSAVSDPEPLLMGANWPDAMQFFSAVQFLQKDCLANPPLEVNAMVQRAFG